MTLKQLHLDTARLYKTWCDELQLVHRNYCDAQQTPIQQCFQNNHLLLSQPSPDLNKVHYYHLYWQKTLIYIIAVAEYGLSVVNIDLSKFMQQTHTKLYSSTALTLS